MPVYEYECKACGRDFEYQQRMSDPDKTICEVCGGALDRLISRTAFSLKGGGWYKDLYASPKPESGDKGGKADKAGGESGGGKADAPAASADKPAAKSDSGAGGSSAGGGGSGGTGSTSGGSASSTSAAAAKAT
jgi:putative FmdB family regulatory protein